MLEKPRDSILKRLIIALLTLLAGPAVGAETQAALLIYQVESPDEPTYFNRLLATAEFLRLDRGAQDTGFILFNRREGVIYSVNHEDRSILVIDPPPLSEALEGQAPEIELQANEQADAPAVGGVKPAQWILRADGAVCRNAFVLPGKMSQAVTAYGEYQRVLARQQALALPAIPQAYQSACDNALHVYAADRLLSKGLPLNVWNEEGYRESLVDFRESFQVPENNFYLPEEYSRSAMGVGL
jgi:hypothetical protein